MVQILNKMVHLKYHFRNMLMSYTYYPINSFKAEIWHKLEEIVPKHSGSIAPNFVCLFKPIKCKHLKLRFLAIFGTCYYSQMPSSRLKCGKKLRNMSPSWFVSTPLHKSLLQAKYSELCMWILSVCSGQSNACIQNQDFGYTLAIVLLLQCLP